MQLRKALVEITTEEIYLGHYITKEINELKGKRIIVYLSPNGAISFKTNPDLKKYAIGSANVAFLEKEYTVIMEIPE